ncbi:hypothetical protein [Microbulbifer litoralis]|uniref:hypothetical protein n=1 Tax=Microbulbifer litoralis TaxID=2933965 RepID=UPI002027CBF3|nr:hypothetical protein [Microbulbifer sp. GX H0434]
MSHVYVLTNQHKQFLSKSNEWIDGRDVARLFRSEHKDVAINQMFEANTRDVSLRIELLQCELNTKRQPLVPDQALGDREPPATRENGDLLAEAESAQGDPEIEPGSPPETPPEQNPEVTPEPVPEAPPEQVPEITPEEPPEIEPERPDEAEGDEDRAALEAG